MDTFGRNTFSQNNFSLFWWITLYDRIQCIIFIDKFFIFTNLLRHNTKHIPCQELIIQYTMGGGESKGKKWSIVG